MIFFVNKAMGMGNSGVEHAQFYRASRFEQVNLSYKYIFVELVKNLHEAMNEWDVSEDKVINLWETFVLEEDYLEYGVREKFEFHEEIIIDSTNTHRLKETYTSSGMFVREHLEKSPSKEKKDMLMVAVYKVEIYNAKTMEKKISYSLLNDDHRGRIISNIHLHNFKGSHLFFRNEVQFQRFFFEYLDDYFTGRNTFIVDRGIESEMALFDRQGRDYHLMGIVHADHLSDRDVPSHPLWNNHYEYLFANIDEVDHIIVATVLQRDDLLIDFPDEVDKIVAIPVGGVRDFDLEVENLETKGNSIEKFITVSRLAKEKHIDVVIKAIVNARKTHPNISLDIYGQGEGKASLNNLIKSLKAEEFIKLKGHSNEIDKIYHDYDAFISGSYSEGFGLTYIEAMNANLPIVTFKARFGALELIKDGENGFLMDFSRQDDNYSVEQLTTGVLKLLNSDYHKIRQATRKSVIEFQDSIIADKWRELINGL